ncbi:MAG: hypothetical protein RMJ39_10040 [Deltaproteobacteria bacterium]|nr:hypothetical protein [Deltaproteobacteria bacterium]
MVLAKMSSRGDEDKVSINPNFTTNCRSGTTCIENKFSPNVLKNNWGGFYFMNGILRDTTVEHNWGDHPKAGYNLTGATKLTFWTRGEKGGEMVEFFVFGIGRNPWTGRPIKPYPDSSPKVSTGWITLSKNWKQYTIDLKNKDLSYVIGGFGWVTNANNLREITFYLDNIKYDKARLDEPRLLVSYETIPSSSDFDTVLKNTAFTYDNALVLMAFSARGDKRRAKLIADAFVYAMKNDRFFKDGRLRNAYQGGDLTLPPGWNPGGREYTVRIPGWWDVKAGTWHEDAYMVGTDTGNMAWVMLALLTYYENFGGDKYLEAVKTLGEWIIKETKDVRGAGGYTGGYKGWEGAQKKMLWKSTEHNLDLYVAFSRLYKITGQKIWKDSALHAKRFVEAMWNEEGGHFWTGTLEDGVTINKQNVPLDVNTWGLMALLDVNKYKRGILWAEKNCYVEADGFKGFDFNNDRDHVWFEGTAQMVIAYQMIGEWNKANLYLSELRKAQTQAINSNGKGIVAASADGLTTGFDWQYFRRLHIGSTAWFIFAEMGYNPFWNSRIKQ